MKAKRVRPGPKNTLVESDPILAEIKKRLAARGHTTISEAAASVGFEPRVLTRILRVGLSADPKQSTVERLNALGIYDLVPKKKTA